VKDEKIRAAIYLRISQDPKEDGLAIERQESDCVGIADSRGWLVTKTYSDTVSASKRNVSRPNYERMFEDFKRGQFEALICWDLDRLTRQPRQLEDWIDASVENGLLLVTANNEADLSNDNGRLFARMKAAVARAEIERKSARQKRKNEQLTDDGRPVPGRRRFGYMSDNMTVMPDEGIKVLRLFEDFGNGRSIRSLSVEMAWRPVRVRETLTNRSYIGEVRHHGRFLPSDKITPIVSVELFEKVQIVLTDPTRKTSPGSAVVHLMSGLANCGICGATMHFQNGYMCSKSTSHVFIKGEKLENAVVWSIHLWANGSVNAENDDSDSNSNETQELLLELQEVNRLRAVQQKLAEMSGADLDLVKRELANLGGAAEKISSKLAQNRADSAQSTLLAALKNSWQKPLDMLGFEEWQASMTEATKLLGVEPSITTISQYEYISRVGRNIDEWLPYWNGLDLEDQRQIVRSLYAVTVNKGRSIDRVVLTLKS
jgi:site-specific DNA recombinase